MLFFATLVAIIFPCFLVRPPFVCQDCLDLSIIPMNDGHDDDHGYSGDDDDDDDNGAGDNDDDDGDDNGDLLVVASGHRETLPLS